jgi:hypothetical protein
MVTTKTIITCCVDVDQIGYPTACATMSNSTIGCRIILFSTDKVFSMAKYTNASLTDVAE